MLWKTGGQELIQLNELLPCEIKERKYSGKSSSSVQYLDAIQNKSYVISA